VDYRILLFLEIVIFFVCQGQLQKAALRNVICGMTSSELQDTVQSYMYIVCFQIHG